MSRSRRKTPITGMTCAKSEKADKQAAHRRTRVAARCMLARGDEAPPPVRLTENPWSYAKDGKRWCGRRNPRLLRK